MVHVQVLFSVEWHFPKNGFKKTERNFCSGSSTRESLGLNRSENNLFNLFQETPIKNISLAEAKTGTYLKITPIKGVFVKIEVSLPKIL